jgi:hypothetical protein
MRGFSVVRVRGGNSDRRENAGYHFPITTVDLVVGEPEDAEAL